MRGRNIHGLVTFPWLAHFRRHTVPDRPGWLKGVVAAGVALLAFAVYANSLPNGLHVDDQQQIVDNPWIRSTDVIGEILTSGVWDHAGRVSSYYRPGMYLLYMATFGLFGLQPWAFHLLNVLLHAGASVLVFLIAWAIFEAVDRVPASPVLAAATAGALFATHPVHTEPVAWAAGVTDVSFSFFFLVALYLYMRPVSRSGLPVLGSATAFFAALLCKEPAITLPVILVAYDVLLRREKLASRRWALRLSPYAAAAVVYVVLRVHALGALAPTAGETTLSAWRYGINVTALFARYLEILVVPVGLNFWHVFEPLSTVVSPAGARALLVVGGFVGLLGLGLRKNRPAVFGVVLMVVPLLPSFHVSALNQGLENAFTERYLYLPVAGFVLAVASLLATVRRLRPAWTPVLVSATILLTVLYSAGTIRRNPVWRDAYTLWSDALGKSPDSAVVHMNYGFALMARGRVEEGRRHLRRAVELDPGRLDVKIRNGIAYAAQGRLEPAVLELSAALELDPESVPAHYNIAVVYERLGWTEQAIRHYRQAVARAPAHGDAHNNLGILLAERGDLPAAERQFEAAVESEPGNPDYRANLERLRSLQPVPDQRE